MDLECGGQAGVDLCNTVTEYLTNGLGAIKSSSIDKTNSSCKCSYRQQGRQQKKREKWVELNGCTTQLLDRPARVPLL